MNLQQLGKHEKGWGFEVVWSNNEKYCAKLLVFNRAGAKTSLVFHKERKKSWFVNTGKFKITFLDIVTGETKYAMLEEGKTADFGELSPHQVECITDSGIIFEVSTPDFVEDRFRLQPGDTQTRSSEQQSSRSS